MKNVILFRKELYLNIFQRSIILFIQLHYLKKKTGGFDLQCASFA